MVGTKCINLVTLQEFVLKHFLIITEVIAVALAFIWPVPGAALSNPTVSLAIVALIFLLTGLKLKTEELKSVISHLDIVLIGCVSSLFVTSLLPNSIIHQLPFANATATGSNDDGFNFGPNAMKLGAILFNSAPCTIATGIIMVTASEGDTMVAVSISTISNLVGCFVTPLIFSLFVETDIMAQDSVKIVKKLGLSLMLPLVVGKLISLFIKPIQDTVIRFKKPLGLVQSLCICVILWIKLSTSIHNGTFSLVGIVDIAIITALMVTVHLMMLLLNFLLSIVFCMSRSHACVMILLVSQKTIVLTAAVATALPPELGDPALILLPCFIAHPSQVLLDAFLIQPLRKSKLFPICVPGCCRRLRPHETGDISRQNETTDQIGFETNDTNVTFQNPVAVAQ